MSDRSRQLFGTDGIRGVAGEFPLTPESTYLIGRALGHDLLRGSWKAQAVLGQDTRESGGWIADRVAAGLAAGGGGGTSPGVGTPPGVPCSGPAPRVPAADVCLRCRSLS